MGSPLVRRDEFEAELAKLRKERRAGKAKEQDPDKAFVTRADLRAALAPILAALDIEEPATEEEPATGEEPAESDPEGIALVQAIHDRKSGEVPPALVTGFENIDKEPAE
jgi:hypothetical protein